MLLFVSWLAAVPAMASTLLVLPDGSGPYPDLQTAVVATADGDTILLGDGVFTGAGNRNLTFAGGSVTFASQGGVPEQCIVDLEHVLGAEARFLVAPRGLRDSGFRGELVRGGRRGGVPARRIPHR